MNFVVSWDSAAVDAVADVADVADDVDDVDVVDVDVDVGDKDNDVDRKDKIASNHSIFWYSGALFHKSLSFFM